LIAGSKVLVVDLDGTLGPIKGAGESYRDILPEPLMVARLQELAAAGWRIIIHSARGMRSHDGNAGEINARVLPVMIEWLNRHQVPFHEIYVGKPWPGDNGFYIDDRSVRPREFIENSLEELERICVRDRLARDGLCQE
jgi:capsule biosynthesis phosphatase